MNCLDRDRWRALSKTVGNGEPEDWYERLMAAYLEPHRHYHNQKHISECLREFDGARDLPENPVCVEVSLWFHDAVYDPRAGDNEERSAELAVQYLQSRRAHDQMLEAVKRLVLATKHHVPGTPDEALLIDIDLSILGQSPERFTEYETQIRQEYIWVPEKIFAEKRGDILRGFLDRPRIFTTDHFLNRYEAPARANLEQSLDRLRHGHA